MQKATFTQQINAPKEKVWEVLWNDKTYRQWTSVFHEGSYAESDWKEGSKILFLGPGRSGMFSVIEKLEPNIYMSFKHLGEVKAGKEQPATPETESWSGALENYRLTETNGVTNLQVELETTDASLDYFNDTFPKALQKIKELAERS